MTRPRTPTKPWDRTGAKADAMKALYGNTPQPFESQPDAEGVERCFEDEERGEGDERQF